MIRKTVTSALILSLIALTGCSLSFEFYVRNLTADKTYTLKLFSTSNVHLSGNVSEYFLTKSEVIEMNSKTRRQMTDTVRTSLMNDTLIIQVPPQTTVMLPYFMYDYKEKLEVKALLTCDTTVIDRFTVYPEHTTEKIKQTTGFYQIIHYYDIGQKDR